MKKILLVAAISAALSPAAFATSGQNGAQSQRDHHPSSRGVEAIYSSWSLSDQQRAQLQTIERNFHHDMQSLHDETAASPQAHHDAMKKLVDEHHQALAKVLNDEQIKVLAAYDRMHQPMRAKGELMKALFASWHLNDDQQQALHDARQAMRDDLDRLKTQKFDSRDAKHAAFAKVKQDQHARMAKILDPQQIKVLEQMRHVTLRGPKGRPPIEGMKALVASWHLDQSKQQAFDDANKAFFAKLYDLHAQPGDAKGEQRADVKAAFEQHREALDKILTPAQVAALKAFRPGPHGHGPHGPGLLDKHAPLPDDDGPDGDGPQA